MKRANGSGSVEQIPNGKWRARVMIAGKRVSLGTYATELELTALCEVCAMDVAEVMDSLGCGD